MLSVLRAPVARSLGAAALACAVVAVPARAVEPAPPAPSYADMADLADSAPEVLRVLVRKMSRVEPERAAGVRPGWGRFYIEAETQALLVGRAAQGGMLRYLVDLPLDARGKAPKLKKVSVILFARSVSGRPGELQLVRPDAQIAWSPEAEARARAILTALVAADAPPRITGVREAIHVPGNLAGEGETQFFLDTADRTAASITVQHRPGEPARWGVSFSEVAAVAGDPPAHDTLAWYRLACFLPERLPPGANLSDSPESRARAEGDYAKVLADLGPCGRSAGPARP